MKVVEKILALPAKGGGETMRMLVERVQFEVEIHSEKAATTTKKGG